MKPTKFYEIFELPGRRKRIFTKALCGDQVYGETILKDKGQKYREWDPRRSKIGAAIHKGLNQLGIAPGSTVLYLGASTGTTVSHISDIVGPDGMVFALDFAPRTTRDLVLLAKKRPNIAPILGDANQPQSYQDYLPKEVDYVFQDIAQKQQAEIFIKNVKQFLKPGALCAVVVKARSVDVTKKPHEVFKRVRAQLEKHFPVTDSRKLDPFEKDHMFFVCKKR